MTALLHIHSHILCRDDLHLSRCCPGNNKRHWRPFLSARIPALYTFIRTHEHMASRMCRYISHSDGLHRSASAERDTADAVLHLERSPLHIEPAGLVLVE